MATIRNLTQSPAESTKQFNQRLGAACFDSPVTGYEAAVVDGLPCIVLITDLVEVDPAMIKEAVAEGDTDHGLTIGESVPSDGPFLIQVSKAGAIRELGDFEANVAALNKRCGGEIDEVAYIQGPDLAWVSDQNDVADGKALANVRRIPVPTTAVYVVVKAFLPEDMPKDLVPAQGSKR
jgi:hypothetical protein